MTLWNGGASKHLSIWRQNMREICLQKLSLPRREQCCDSKARGKLWALRNRQSSRTDIRTYFKSQIESIVVITLQIFLAKCAVLRLENIRSCDTFRQIGSERYLTVYGPFGRTWSESAIVLFVLLPSKRSNGQLAMGFASGRYRNRYPDSRTLCS